MTLIYIGLLIWAAVFLIASYSATINGSTWGMWVTGFSLWFIFAVILGIAFFYK